MIMDQVTTGEVRSMQDVDSTEMSLDPDSIRAIMNVLTEMYPDGIAAIIREYTANGLDSHIEANQTRPVEVTLPSEDSPYFVVEDFGLGMGEYDLKEVYGVYGRSTKRKTNKTNGMFGLGSKSALASVNAFTMIAIKDGIQYNVLIQKNDEGIGKLDIRSTQKTDKGNGVKISIPVPLNEVASFSEKAENVFLLWEEGSVLVDGAAPVTLIDKGYEKVSNLAYLSHGRSFSNIRVAMGGFIYNVDGMSYSTREEIFRDAKVLQNRNIVINAGMGDVKLSPARESILSNAQNMRYLRNRLKELYTYLRDNAIADIQKAPNVFAAMKTFETYHFLGLRDVTYNGEKMIHTLEVSMDQYMWEPRKSRRTKLPYKEQLRVATDAEQCMVIDTENCEKINADVSRILTPFRDMHPEFPDDGKFLVGNFSNLRNNTFVKAMEENGLIRVFNADKAVADAKEYRKANRPKRSGGGGARGSITYLTFTNDGEGVAQEDLTIAEIRELDQAFVLQQSKDEYYRDYYGVFSRHCVEGETLILVKPTRSAEVLERRIKDDVETLTLENFKDIFSERIKEQLEEKPADFSHVVSNLTEDWKCGNFFRAIIGNIEEWEIESPFLNKMAETYQSGSLEIVTRNQRRINDIKRGLGNFDFFADGEIENYIGVPSLRDEHEKISNHFAFLIVGSNSTSSNVRNEFLRAMLNDFYKKFGDPAF